MRTERLLLKNRKFCQNTLAGAVLHRLLILRMSNGAKSLPNYLTHLHRKNMKMQESLFLTAFSHLLQLSMESMKRWISSASMAAIFLNRPAVSAIFLVKCRQKWLNIQISMALKLTLSADELQNSFIPMLIFRLQALSIPTFRTAHLMWLSATCRLAIWISPTNSTELRNYTISSLHKLWIRWKRAVLLLSSLLKEHLTRKAKVSVCSWHRKLI